LALVIATFVGINIIYDYVRVGCCIVLSAWFVLALFGFSEWAMFWSV
jgi:hypothetical protein